MTNKQPNLQIHLQDQLLIGAIAGLVASGQRDAESILIEAKAITASFSTQNPAQLIDWNQAPDSALALSVDDDGGATWFDLPPIYDAKHGEWYAPNGAKLAQAAPNFGIRGGSSAMFIRKGGE